MMRWPLLALGGAALIGLAACDSRDYEAEIADLEAQLQDAETRLQEQMAANEDLNAQMAELEQAGGQAPEAVQTELNEAYTTAQRTYERLGAIQREPGADPQLIEEAVVVLQEDVQAMMDSLQTAGQELGVTFEEGAAEMGGAAAGGASGQAEPAAGQEGEAEPTGEEAQQQQSQ